jgi:hypothetical protein
VQVCKEICSRPGAAIKLTVENGQLKRPQQDKCEDPNAKKQKKKKKKKADPITGL